MYQCIYLDPPWPENGGGGRGAQNHYPTITKREHILDVIFGSGVFRPADNAHMYLWVTNNYMPWGLWLMKKLGFDYKTMITWPKMAQSTGYYFAGKTEHILFGVRGTLPPVERVSSTTLLDTTMNNRKAGHSVKPPETYSVIAGCTPGPRLELFARRPQPGWDAWGRDMVDANGQALPPGKILRCADDGSMSVCDPL